MSVRIAYGVCMYCRYLVSGERVVAQGFGGGGPGAITSSGTCPLCLADPLRGRLDRPDWLQP